jgi:hypothetical protein
VNKVQTQKVELEQPKNLESFAKKTVLIAGVKIDHLAETD